MSPPAPLKLRRHIVGAMLAGLILRIALVLLCREDVPAGDAATYRRLAINLATHDTYSTEESPPFTPSLVRAPFTALALSLPYRVLGATEFGGHALLVVVGLAGVLVLALGVGKHAPSLAVPILWVLALSPFGALYASRLLCETFASSAISIAVGALLMLSPMRAAVVCGCSLGVAALTRDVNLPLLVLLPLAAFVLFRSASPSFRFRHVLASIVASAFVIGPWTARNVLVGTPALISKGLLGVNLWIGTWERNPNWMHGDHEYPPEAYDSPAEERTVAAFRRSPLASDAAFLEIAIERMRTRPGRTLAVWLRRAPYLWIGSRTELFEFRPEFLARGRPAWTVLKSAAWGLNLLLLGFSILGAVHVVRTRHSLRILLAPIVFTAGIYFPFHSTENRYSEPVYALVIVLAVLGGAAALQWVVTKRRNQSQLST